MSQYSPSTGKAEGVTPPAPVYPAPRTNSYRLMLALGGFILAAASTIGGLFHWYTVGLINEHALGGHPAQIRAVREALRNSNDQLEGRLQHIEETLGRLEAQGATAEQLRTQAARSETARGRIGAKLQTRVEAYIAGNEQRLKNIEEVVRETRETVRELARR